MDHERVRLLLSLALCRTGNLAEAEEVLRGAVGARRAALDPGLPDVAPSMRELATVLASTGDSAGARALLEEGRGIVLRRLDASDPEPPATRR